ncbi:MULTISPECIES: ferredoxin [unclassified Gordonia (in: high G+C Gram-positive bacteria)]
MKICIDTDKCTGLGLCEAIAPDHFEVGADGTLVLLNADVSADEVATIEEAISTCPTEAISLEP